MTNEEKPTLADFLKGKLFSSGLEIAVQQMPYMLRIDLLEQLCEGKKVIHIGFADHKDLIIKKIQNNMWLHGRILKKAKECVGIDIDMEAVKFVKENLRIVDVYSLDVERDELPSHVQSEKWDYVLLPEVLEHVDNPVSFLKTIKMKFTSIADKIIVTVPNAFKFENFLNAMRDREAINSDHRYWFTVYTIAKVMTLSGITMENFYLVNSYDNPAYHHITLKTPLFRDDIVIIGRFS